MLPHAYALAIRWKVTGDDAYANKAIGILKLPGPAVLKFIGCTSDKYLASGICGFQLANAAEIFAPTKAGHGCRILRVSKTTMMQPFSIHVDHNFLVNQQWLPV